MNIPGIDDAEVKTPLDETDAADAALDNSGLGLDPSENESFEEDFSEISEFQLVAEGIHPARVIDFEKVISKSSGNPTYEWQFMVTDGVSKGQEIKFWTSLQPSARWKAAACLQAIGIKAQGSIVRFTKADVVGKLCMIKVVHEEYNGRMTNKIDSVFPPQANVSSDTEPF